MTKKFGFTLAEVLITLVIIGVIAAMTIPTLMSNTNQQENKTAFKKAMSTLNQAITMQYALDGTTLDTVMGAATPADTSVANTGLINGFLTQRLQIVNTTTGRGLNIGNGAGTNYAVFLSDGMAIELPATRTKTATCTADTNCIFSMLVDVNGNKGKCVASETTTNVADCYPLNVYTDSVKPGNELAKKVMYGGV